ncbi:MAG: hypothetical protein AAF646_11945 [Pseudomonadota bacterium]
MKPQILAAATAIALGLGTAGAIAQDDMVMGQGHSMLTGALFNALSAEGFDTSNINNLTLSQVAQIRQLMSDDMGTTERGRIERILEDAAS